MNKPMLATLIEEPFDDPDWIFEIKWDGFRAIATIKNGKIDLRSRTNQSFNLKFPEIVDALKKIKGSAVLDGEIVVLDEEGISRFQLLQQKKEGTLCYYVFDILEKDGKDLRGLPLIERKKILKRTLKGPIILYSDHIEGHGVALFKKASQKGLEGIIGKRKDSTYQSRRSRDWVKIKTHLKQEMVIGGFTEPRGARQKFGSLLVGIYNKKKELIYAGHVGGGFSGSLLNSVYKELKPLIQKTCPFKTVPKTNTRATWVAPKLLAEISFAEWTKDNIMRQPIFQGINLDKMYWQGFTKGDLLDYYQAVGRTMLPYLKNRPIMLHRYPEGIKGEQFYQKNLEKHPDFVKTVPIKQENRVINYLLINDLQSLLYAANLGSIEIHPFLSTTLDLDSPSFTVIDLDPHDVPFKKLIEVAKTLHELLDSWRIKNFCKTSGNKGLHVFIPLKDGYSYEQSRQFAELIGHVLHEKFPRITSLERSPKKREKKIYIDCLQNRTRQTVVAPYSVRGNAYAGVSTPLDWSEVEPGLDPKDYTIKTVPARIKDMGDLFKGLLKGKVDIQKAVLRL